MPFTLSSFSLTLSDSVGTLGFEALGAWQSVGTLGQSVGTLGNALGAWIALVRMDESVGTLGQNRWYDWQKQWTAWTTKRLDVWLSD